MPRPHEALQACLDEVSRCLDRVASRARLPQSRDMTALLQTCARVRALLPLLESLPQPHEYLLRMQLQNVPDHLAHLEKETQVLFQEAKQQRHARLMSALRLGELAVAVSRSLGCLVALGLCLFTGSALLPTAILCIIALASTMQAGFLGCWRGKDLSKPTALRLLLEQQHAVERQGQRLMQHLRDVQGELHSREAGASSW